MYSVNGVENIRSKFREMLAQELFIQDKTGVKLLEIIGANFIADEPFIFGEPNEKYIEREIAWYETQSLNVNTIPGGPPAIWKQVADSDGFINSNYGWCVYSNQNGLQYQKVLNELKSFPYSRRAVMIYTRPSMWNDYNKNGMSDFMCTNTVQYLIREEKLISVVQMRSNDVLFGYRNDYAWQSYIQNKLANHLGIESGLIYWNVGSLHVYERHFSLIK